MIFHKKKKDSTKTETQELIDILNGLDWQYGVRLDIPHERASLQMLYNENRPLFWLIAQQKQFSLDDYYYKVEGVQLERQGPKIPRPEPKKKTWSVQAI